MNEEEITLEEAEKVYGITIKFSKMPTNGEARFRLRSKDGNDYIKTVTKDNAGGWQKAHFHKGLYEKYIVQKGSIICAICLNNEITANVYKQGECFTIEKNIPHNIYMNKETIIHTIKIGDAIINPESDGKADWWCADKVCPELNNEEILDDILKNPEKYKKPHHINTCNYAVKQEKEKLHYSKAYMHFDNLIWKLPVWIFALLAAGVAFLKLNTDNISTGNTLFGFVFFGLSLFGISLSYALYRFRIHQARHKPEGKRNPVSPQIVIHFLSNILIVILILIGVHFITKGSLCLAIIILSIIIGFLLSLIFELISFRDRKTNKYLQSNGENVS
jgi:hypothetical protein